MKYEVNVPDELNDVLIVMADKKKKSYESYLESIIESFLAARYRAPYKEAIDKMPYTDLSKVDMTATSVEPVIIKPIK